MVATFGYHYITPPKKERHCMFANLSKLSDLKCGLISQDLVLYKALLWQSSVDNMWIIYTKTLILVVKGLLPLWSFPCKWRKDVSLRKFSTPIHNNTEAERIWRHINPSFINFLDKIFWKLFRKYITWFIKLGIKLDNDIVSLSMCYIVFNIIWDMLTNTSLIGNKGNRICSNLTRCIIML